MPRTGSAAPADPLARRIRRRTREVLAQAAALCDAHRVPLPDPLVRLDLRGQAAGQARWRAGERPVLRFNRQIAERHTADFLARTVVHEVAHLVTLACHGRTRPHGREWRAVMAELGIPQAERCHDYPVSADEVRRQRRWAYRCGCAEHAVSTTRHKRILRGARYLCRRCGGPLMRVNPAGD